MRMPNRLVVALATATLFSFAAVAEARALVVAGPVQPGQRAAQADVIVLGKVIEIEKDVVEAAPAKGAPKDVKVSYKIAVLKIEDPILGGKGLTQFRVGFPSDVVAPGVPAPQDNNVIRPGIAVAQLPGRIRAPGFAPVTLTEGMEGCFFLARHHEADFYVVAANGTAAPLLKKDEAYPKQLEEVKKVAQAIDDPASALKAKALEDRFRAAQIILQRYQQNMTGATTREPIPAEENTLIVKLLAELPWQPDMTKPRTGSDPVPPSRSALWYMINPQEFGFKQPSFQRKAGDPPLDANKIMDETTTAFLKDNADKIKIKRWAK